MREIYAVELRGQPDSDSSKAWELVRSWADKRLRPSEGHPTPASIEADEVAASGARYLALEQFDDRDESLIWRSEVALGAPGQPLHVTVRIRLGAQAGAPLAPLQYEFRTPVIVRTLLREFEVLDGAERCAPSNVELGPSDIPALADFLTSRERRLPVVVVSCDGTGTLLDPQQLAKQLAGLAHVRSLSSTFASRALTYAIGPSLSVWQGAVRVYFPEFSLDDDPRSHRLYHSDRVSEDLIARLRSWLSAVSSSRTPSHPVFADLRADRRQRLKAASEDAELVKLVEEYTGELERDLRAREGDVEELLRQNSALVESKEELESSLAEVKRSFAEYTNYLGQTESVPHEGQMADEPTSVRDAIGALVQLSATAWYCSRVQVSGQAIKSAREFSDYQRPGEMLRAVQAVMEAGALYHDDRLGEPPADFFARRGFGYGAQPEPHLKVDESTSPDQCLRIYWRIDPQSRLWEISHIGRHL